MRHALLSLSLLLGAAPASAEGAPRLLHIGLSASPDVDPKVARTLEDTIVAHLDGAAKRRALELVSPSQVRDLLKEARGCPRKACRLALLQRVHASYGLAGAIERRPLGYRVSLWLETKDGTFVRAVRLEGEVPALVGGLREAVEGALEEAAPATAAARAKLEQRAQKKLQRGRAKDAAKDLEEAVALAPFSPEGARLSLLALHALDRAGDEDALLAALDDVLETYGPASAFAKAALGGEALARDIERVLKELLSRRGTAAHKRALASGDAEARRAGLARARTLYTRYLDGLGLLAEDGLLSEAARADEEAAEMAHYLGEVSFALGDEDPAAFLEAARAYRAAREAKGPYDPVEAARSALFADEAQLRARGIDVTVPKAPALPLTTDGGAAPGDVDVDLAALAAAYHEDALALARLAPKHEDTPAFLYRAAQLLVALGQPGEGQPLLMRIANDWPASPAGRAAKAALASGR